MLIGDMTKYLPKFGMDSYKNKYRPTYHIYSCFPLSVLNLPEVKKKEAFSEGKLKQNMAVLIQKSKTL